MPRTKKIHLAVTLTHKGATLTRSLCDNGVGSDNMVHDFAGVPREVAGEYGEHLCQACRMRIPFAP